MPSLGGVASPDSSAKAAEGPARKRALDQAEVKSEAKRPAISIGSDGLHERVSKEQLQVSEHTLCCLPGGV